MVQLIKGVVDTQKNSYRSIGQVSAGDDLELELEVKMNGQPIEFINPECELLIKKSDNNKVRQTKDIIYQDGKFKIKVDEQGVTYPGIVSNQLVINDEGRVSTCLFYFNVGASLEREVLQSISKVETLEQLDEYVVTAFSNLDEYETRLTELDGTMKTTNEEITVNESERKVNESERKTNETLRIENEKERVKKENERSEAEIDRKESELDRIKNENARRIAENTRIARENARENAEVNRNAIFEENEVIRNEAEKLREKAEAKRKENFSNLESLNEKLNEAEAERVRAEGNRESKETERQLAESEREKAEANRENTYTNFNDAEVDRRNNENARIQAENLRVQAESIRSERFETAQSTRETKFEESQNTRDELFKASETARATEEIAREKAESIREGNEAIRVNSESLRESAENARQQEEIKRSQAEVLRVEAEKERELSYEEIKKDNSTFKDNINSQYEDIITKNTEFKEQMNTDFGNAKTDYFGEEHLNVVDRLNSDFDNVHQRINDSSYLEYSSSNITADNSYYGLTKEMSIKGRTLQNLTKLKSGVLNYSPTPSNSLFVNPIYSLKANTDYTIIINIKSNTLDSTFKLSLHGANQTLWKSINVYKKTGEFRFLFNENLEISSVRFYTDNTNEGSAEIDDILLLEGNHTDTNSEELSYVEGIKSVGESEVTEDGKYKISWKSCGKNLVDYSLIKWSTTVSKGITFTYNKGNNFIEVNGTSIDTYSTSPTIGLAKKLKNGKTYIASGYSENGNSYSYMLRVVYYDGSVLYRSSIVFDETIMKEISAYFNIANSGVTITNDKVYVQVEENTISTVYEHPILSYQELQLTEPLRSLPNGVCDEILEDGTEIRRVNKLIIDYNHIWYKDGAINEENTMRFGYNIEQIYTSKDGSKNKISDWTTNMLHDVVQYYTDSESISFNVSKVSIRVLKSKLSEESVTGFKQWLQNNPITLYYELIEPIIIKHNKNMNLKTFDGTTHMTSDNYLQPTISCKVPSNVQAVVSSLMLENEELNNTISVMSLKNEETELENIETNLDQDVRLTMLELGVI